MRRLSALFNRIISRLGLGRASRPEDIPAKLDATALEKAMQEARFLQGQHGVDARALAPGEFPTLPKRADKA